MVICIPVNLRTFYDSHTLSDFFSTGNHGRLIDYVIPGLLIATQGAMTVIMSASRRCGGRTAW